MSGQVTGPKRLVLVSSIIGNYTFVAKGRMERWRQSGHSAVELGSKMNVAKVPNARVCASIAFNLIASLILLPAFALPCCSSARISIRGAAYARQLPRV